MNARFVESIDEIAPEHWDRLAGSQPFLRHRFLSLLETTGCTGPGTGWTPHHLLLGEDGRPDGAVPLYLKDHSAGEFVFDWAWADVYQRAGRPWYPKLVAAVPFSPIQGPRLLCGDAAPAELAAALVEEARDLGVASLQVLFPMPEEMPVLVETGLLARNDCRFLWRNRDYRDFEDFLAALSSRRRKNVRRERRKVREAGIEHEVLRGDELPEADLERIYACYLDPYLRRGMQPYLSPEFFRGLMRDMPEQMVLFVARRSGTIVAMALCLRDEGALYGRHWGALEDVEFLHFETCYYQGIDYCIREGLDRFDPGTQGEHKLLRGFEPTEYHAAYWVRDEDFRQVLAPYLAREREAVLEYIRRAGEVLPFHQ